MKIFLEVDRGMKIIGVFLGGRGGGQGKLLHLPCTCLLSRELNSSAYNIHIKFLNPPPQQQQKINNVSLSR